MLRRVRTACTAGSQCINGLLRRVEPALRRRPRVYGIESMAESTIDEKRLSGERLRNADACARAFVVTARLDRAPGPTSRRAPRRGAARGRCGGDARGGRSLARAGSPWAMAARASSSRMRSAESCDARVDDVADGIVAACAVESASAATVVMAVAVGSAVVSGAVWGAAGRRDRRRPPAAPVRPRARHTAPRRRRLRGRTRSSGAFSVSRASCRFSGGTATPAAVRSAPESPHGAHQALTRPGTNVRRGRLGLAKRPDKIGIERGDRFVHRAPRATRSREPRRHQLPARQAKPRVRGVERDVEH